MPSTSAYYPSVMKLADDGARLAAVQSKLPGDAPREIDELDVEKRRARLEGQRHGRDIDFLTHPLGIGHLKAIAARNPRRRRRSHQPAG